MQRKMELLQDQSSRNASNVALGTSSRQEAVELRSTGRPKAPVPTRAFQKEEKQADPLSRVTGPRMNPSVDVGRPPRPFRHLRMAERCTPDPSSSRAPVHSALVQKSVTAITNPAGRLSVRMLGEH